MMKKKMLKKVGIVGHFAVGKDFYDGQTVKTRALFKALQNHLGENHILKVDTLGGLKYIIKILIKTFTLFPKCQNIIMLPAQNGLLIFSFLFRICNVIYRRKLHYSVIGGWLPEYVQTHKFADRALRKFDGIYVETTTMKTALESQGYTNVSIVPNFKSIDILNPSELISSHSKPYSFCTFSRVMKEKGIEDAIDAIKKINTRKGEPLCSLDIYGKIDDSYKERFDALQKEFPEYIRYCGCVDPNKSVDVLKDYYALLFPTHFKTEGIPGTIIDALCSGVITIANRWNSADDVVLHNQTGIIYPTNEFSDLYESILWTVENEEKVLIMKNDCLLFAQKFSSENAMKVLCDKLD